MARQSTPTPPQHAPSDATLTSAEAFAEYCERCGDTPVLTQAELRVEVHVAGLRYDNLDEAFWAGLLRRPDHRHL